MEDINRLKLLLVEKKKTRKWLSGQLGITPSTVSKWCTNTSQPEMETLARIVQQPMTIMMSTKQFIARARKEHGRMFR